MVDKIAPTVPLMQVELRVNYTTYLLLPYDDAAKLVALLAKASQYTKPYGDEVVTYANHCPQGIELKPCDMDELAIIKKCAVMGISYQAYMESLKDES